MKLLITGAAGFVGYHLSKRLVAEGLEVVGFDNINDYYDVRLKYGRLSDLGIDKGTIVEGEVVKSTIANFSFIKADLCNRELIWDLMKTEKFDVVINLAAQAGVRFSIDHPYKYLQSNLEGFLNVLEGCRHYPVKHLIYASSSSVYGANKKVPFSTDDSVDHPISLYAATKKSNELMAHTYSHLYDIPVSGLRFFTVYGPWGRPDMAYFKFVKAINENKTIDIYNHGDMYRDFTYIDDIVESIFRLIDKTPQKAACDSEVAAYKVYNIGNSSPETLKDFISYIEQALGKEAEKNYLPMQPGDVYKTYADVSDLERVVGYKPQKTLKEGISLFVDWYKSWGK